MQSIGDAVQWQPTESVSLIMNSPTVSATSRAAAGPSTVTNCDVLVIGGGPAGSTAAALLAERGYRVTVLEKARHPRFHIGESLLPANMPLFDKLGVAAEVKAIGMEKWGAQFNSPWHDHVQTVEFGQALDKSQPMAYQVKRAQFDEILLRNASRKNAQVIEGCEAQGVTFLPRSAGVVARVVIEAQHEGGRDERFRAKFLIDASGRDTFLGNRLKVKQRNTAHNSAALYGHFSGAERSTGKTEGDISLYWFEHGWFWFIPLPDGVTSVGAVAWPHYFKTRKGKSLDQFLLETIALSPKLHARLSTAQLVSPAEATGNYSYVCDRTRGENYLLLGDAYTFIDPVFSSGVLFAMQSAFAGADAVDACLRKAQRAASALRHFDKTMRLGPKVFTWFIYRVTNPALRNLLMTPNHRLQLQATILSILAGDIYGTTRIRSRLIIFKAAYYIASLFNLRRTWNAMRARKLNILSVDNAGPVSR